MPDRMSEKELYLLINQLNMEPTADDSQESSTFFIDVNTTDDNYGRVYVRANKIFVLNPPPGGSSAVISAVLPVVIYVNDEKISGPTEVTSDDTINWEISEPPLYSITVSEDKLQAVFTLYSSKRFAWNLNNHSPAAWLEVTATMNTEVEHGQLSLNKIITDFEKKSITQNLNISGIHAELMNPTFHPFPVAMGRAPVPGEDARLEIYFAETIESEFSEIEGQVDYRSHLRIPSAVRGEVIARKIPLVEGITGYDVYGEVLYPAQPVDIIIIAKNQTVLLVNNEIRALREGRPRMTGDKIKYFDICTSYIVPGNVNIKTGNIVFSGDILVHGDVEDNMLIESLGNVYVAGNVHNSTITATGSILIKGNATNSKLYSGYFGVMYNRIYNASEILIEELKQLQKAVSMLSHAVENRKQSVKYGHAVLLLLESKFKKIPQVTKELLTVLTQVQEGFQHDLDKVMHVLNVFLNPVLLVDYVNESSLIGFTNALQELHSGVARLQEVKVEVAIGKCQNTTIKSNGDITIYRNGIVHSDLFSSGNITFVRSTSMCRGSHLEAGGKISAGFVGGESGAQSFLKAKQSVSVRKMYLGKVTVDRYTTDIDEPVENVVFDRDTVQNMALKRT
ncbi:flagellar assembly protein A [Paenibacillus sp. sgz500958]|uniref:flagellar assembly protein A n=1 Tax=Paenibacillus sp. sgz500958 TaxID=3242475 RepID=UPI0036D3A41A